MNFPLHLSVLLFLQTGCSPKDESTKAVSSVGLDFPSAEESTLAFSAVDYSLSSLQIMERDFGFIHHFYVDSNLLVGDLLREMLNDSLKLVERQVDEVQFVVQKTQIIATVGVQTRSFSISTLNNIEDLLFLLKPVAQFLDSNLSDSVERAEVEYLLINGALSALDPHSILLPPVQAAEMEVDNQGEFGGLGIEINIQEGQLTVKQPIEGTPAWKAGLQAEDRIVRIEDTSTINMDLSEAVSLLRGKVGTVVNIMLARQGWPNAKPFAITRGRIKIDPVKGELLSGDIGYIKIQSFHQNVSEDLDLFLKDLAKETKTGSLKGLVLDLRNNPGGYLNQAIKVSDKFIKNGVIVATIEGAKREREENIARPSNTVSDIPIAVLVNGNSASASEIVAGALRNQGRGIIIGERTFGKGSVQHLYGNPDESRLKLTVAQYLTPGDQSIQSIGIPPDVLLKPSIIRPADENRSEMISLYWREWLSRESSLDNHLEYDSLMDGDTSFSVRYLLEEQKVGTILKPAEDWEVIFAREVLSSSMGTDRRACLKAAKLIVEEIEGNESGKIGKAFAQQGIDWSEGAPLESLKANISLKYGDDGVLDAGVEENVNLVIENPTDQEWSQISAFITSDNPSLNHREFYFGKISANSTASKSLKIQLPTGYGSEKGEVQVHLRDPGSEKQVETMLYETKSLGRPQFSVHISLDDRKSGDVKGDGDGQPEVGETVALKIKVTNIGLGPAIQPYVRLKNRSRKQIDLIKGTLEVGEYSKAGESCEEGAENCYRRLEAGESASESLLLELREAPKDGLWKLEVLVGSNLSFDYNTAVLGGFSDYFQMKYSLEMDSKVFEPLLLQQPTITLEETKTNGNILGLTGYVLDDSGVTDIIVFHGEDKVLYQGETGLNAKIPFALEYELEEKNNPFYILTKDNQGLVSSLYLHYWHQGE